MQAKHPDRLVRRVAVAAGLAALLVAGPAAAGTEVDTETRRLDGSKRVRKGKAFFDGPRMRVDTDGGRRVIVYRGDRGIVWVIDHKRQSYIEVEKPTSAALAKQAQVQLDGLSPEKRAAGQLGVAAASGVQVKETGAVDKVNGIPCTEVQVSSGGSRLADVCRATYEQAGVDRATFAAVRDLQDLLGGSLAAMMPRKTREEGLAAVESFAQLEGVPMRVRTYDEGAAETETVVTRLQEKAFPVANFDLPKGYRPQISINIR